MKEVSISIFLGSILQGVHSLVMVKYPDNPDKIMTKNPKYPDIFQIFCHVKSIIHFDYSQRKKETKIKKVMF